MIIISIAFHPCVPPSLTLTDSKVKVAQEMKTENSILFEIYSLIKSKRCVFGTYLWSSMLMALIVPWRVFKGDN